MQQYRSVRAMTEAICKPLYLEDHLIQSISDVSPPKWHLAHTTWFFETFLLMPHLRNYQPFDPLFHYLFNSYYHGIGNPFPRHQRGLLSRPTVATVYAYRTSINEYLLNLIDQAPTEQLLLISPLITLGLNHEQQHQELLLMDIKHNFSMDPRFPAYRPGPPMPPTKPATEIDFSYREGGIVTLGSSSTAFCFDNELPQHPVFIQPYLIANRLVTNAEYIEFIAAGGYQNPRWWLADGWDYVQTHRWAAPLYWEKFDNHWHIFTLAGLQPLNAAEPVAHVSFFEADAYARWRGKRLPTESEWEHFVIHLNLDSNNGNFMEREIYHPLPSFLHKTVPQQFFGDLWEWTASPYGPYPNFKPLKGALGEYNGKFMNNQFVLRGGCCVTPASHIRASYRNFFQPDKRWQFSGIRLADNA